MCRWLVLPATVTASGAPRDSSTTTARLDDVYGSSARIGGSSTTTPPLNDVFCSSTEDSRSSDNPTTTPAARQRLRQLGEEQRQLNDDPGTSSLSSTVRRSTPESDDPGSSMTSAAILGWSRQHHLNPGLISAWSRPDPTWSRPDPGKIAAILVDLQLILAIFRGLKRLRSSSVAYHYWHLTVIPSLRGNRIVISHLSLLELKTFVTLQKHRDNATCHSFSCFI